MGEDEEPRVEAPAASTSPAEFNGAPPDLLWISEGVDTVISTIYIYQDKETGRLKTILWESSPELKATGMPEFPIETKWSVPSKAQLESYREKASRYNREARAVLVQRSRMEELIVQNHLLEMKVGSGEHQKAIELNRDKRGGLTAESLAYINKLHPSVMDMMLAKFVDEAALIL